MKIRTALSLFALVSIAPPLLAAPSPADVTSAMKRAATYFAGTVAVEGGYVYYTSPDQTKRLGEGVALSLIHISEPTRPY